LAAPEYNCTEL